MSALNFLIRIHIFGSLFLGAQLSLAQGQRVRDGGPESVNVLLEENARMKKSLTSKNLLEQWEARKTAFAERTGLSFGSDYSNQFFTTSRSPDGASSSAVSGMYRFYGKWELFNQGEKNSGTLNWKVEHRHRYSNVPPSAFSLNLGNVGVMGAPFSDQNLRLTNLYWRQGLGERMVSYIGFLDVTDFVDVYALASPWTGFTNLNYSTGASSMALPNDATFGAMIGLWVTDNLYAIGSLTDMNANPTDPFHSIETFFTKNEYFKSIELGWTASKDRFYTDNIHLTLWHVDGVEEFNSPDGWGVNFSASYWINDKVMPFLRLGVAEDGGSLLEDSVNVGLAFNVVENRDLIGIAANWGNPNEDTFGANLSDQYSLEAFYRLQVTQNIRLTPSLQLLFDPALNATEDFVAVFGLRGVLTF